MADIEGIAVSTSTGMRRTAVRLGKLASATLLVTALIGAATFATGWWVFDGSTGWLVVGGALCAAPFIAAVAAWWLVRGTLSLAGGLLGDLRAYLGGGLAASRESGVLIDHDSGQSLGIQARSYRGLRTELYERRRELPALYAGVRAITAVPGLAAVAVIGTLLVGGLGTILLIGGVID